MDKEKKEEPDYSKKEEHERKHEPEKKPEVHVEKAEPRTKEEAMTSPSATREVTVENKQADKSVADAYLDRAKQILEEHGGLEANIGITSEYWSLMNAYRAEVNKVK